MSTDDSTFAWDVELPTAARSSFSNARPRAKVVVTTPHRGTETISVPMSVGKVLKSKHDADEVALTGRSELLFVVHDVSRKCALARVSRLVNKRDYASQELLEKLSRDGYHASVCEEVLGLAVDAGWVNDRRYADVFVRSKLNCGWGPARIESELRRRGIEPESLAGWPYEYLGEDDVDERAYALARTRRVAPQRGYEKLVRFLCGKGYEIGVACRAARRVIDEQDIDDTPEL